MKELTHNELLFHESVNPPHPNGRRCFKAWGYYDPVRWLTQEEELKYQEIDNRLKRTDVRPKGWESYKL